MTSPKMVVIGSINMDLVVETTRFPHKGETILGQSYCQFPGGKGANQAVAAARLEADVTMIGCVGHDAFGVELLNGLKEENIRTHAVKVSEAEPTGVAFITVAEQDNHIVVVPGANHAVTVEWIDEHRHELETADIIVTQLEIPLAVVEHAAGIAKKAGVPFLLNPAPVQELSDSLLQSVSYITPNETEFALLNGGQGFQCEAGLLLEKVNKAVVVTLGEQGAAFQAKEQEQASFVNGYSVEAIDTTGAGDCFNGALAVALASGEHLADAVSFATKAAAVSVTKFGAQTGMPRREEVANRFREG